MTSKELKQLLTRQWPSLNKRWLQPDPIHAYDTEYDDDFTFAELNGYVQVALAKLASEDLIPERDYEKNRADCDNWARWIQAEVTKAYSKNMRGKPNKGAMAFGFDAIPGHALNVAIGHGKIYLWNYGQPSELDNAPVTLLDFY